ncbi:23S rRNA (guanosine(2251)-2'-O)-methyltransferase RlmB [Candidatus Poribacteria bacterium]|nr:23S rRNA (guanosine(2251)-2'-O)-methyltransferase RlmB [Candidatus Poribacteria bacterium]
MDVEIIKGRNAVLEILRSSRRHVIELVVRKSPNDPKLRAAVEIARRRGIKVVFQRTEELDRLAEGRKHQGIVAITSPVRYSTLDQIIDKAFLSKRVPLIVVLDHIQDPHNLGAIIRTAEAVGVHGVVIPKRRAAGLTPTVVKISSGAADHIPVARVSNIAMTLERLKEEGIWIVGLMPEAERNIYQIDMRIPLALVIGSEGKGLSRLVSERCDMLVSIPMFGDISSLNASVAAAVALYEAVRQRISSSQGHLSYTP